MTKNDQRFVYDGYLQIANFHCSPSSFTSVFIWDPTEPVATRPLVWNRKGDFEYYVFDGNKNVSEVVASNNDVAAHYEYAPFGALTVSSGVSAAANPWRFSSEYAEDDTATVYYNYRHYEPVTGRWMQRDPIGECGAQVLIFLFDDISRVLHQVTEFCFASNSSVGFFDRIGLWREASEEEKKKSGGVYCNKDCKLKVRMPKDPMPQYPPDCIRAHEQQHIKDLPKNAKDLCKKDDNGCCKVKGMSPDENDYGGKDKLEQSECKAYLATAQCCFNKIFDASKPRIVDWQNPSHRGEVLKAKTCVLFARDKLFSNIGKKKSPCEKYRDQFDKYLKIFTDRGF